MGEEVFIVGIVFFSCVTVIKMLTDARTRNRLIDRGLADDKIREIYGASAVNQSASSLKWGMVLVGIGLAVLVGQLFPHWASSEITWGLMFLFAGIGFLIYYPVAKRLQENKGSNPSSHSQA